MTKCNYINLINKLRISHIYCTYLTSKRVLIVETYSNNLKTKLSYPSKPTFEIV